MGVATGEGGMGYMSPRFEILGNVPHQKSDFEIKFSEYLPNLKIFRYFQNKVGEIRGEIGILV